MLILLLVSYSLGFSQTTMDRLNDANELYYSNPDSVFLIYRTIEHRLKNTNNVLEIAEARMGMARHYLLKTRFDESMDLLNKAMETFEKENRLSKLAKCYSLKSILSGRLFDNEKQSLYSYKALELYTQVNDKKGIISILTNMSFNFLEAQENDSALLSLVRLKKVENEMEEVSKYFFHQNFAFYYYKVKDYKNSLKEYNIALAIAENEEMIDSKTSCLKSIAETYIALKQYETAKSYLNQSLKLATDNNLLHESNEAYIGLIKLYELQGNYKEAYRLEKLNDKVEKEIYNLEKITKINEIEGQLKLTEKEHIIAQNELDIKSEQLNTIEAKSKVTQLFFVVLLSIIVIIFIIIILLRARKLNTKINAQKMMLQEKNIEITDSINYAKRIQSAILPSTEYFKKNLPNSFIIYKPKDIVAGDFYWMQNIKDNVLFAAADCTGHGVPGAMVSVVCSNSLNQSLKDSQSANPSEIIEITRKIVKESLNKGDENDVRDGMDISLCSLNTETNELQYAGANNPLYIIRNGALIEIKGDKQPVGQFINEFPFSNHIEQLEKGDTVYLFSDGYADQFGGPKGKKFMYKQFKQLLLDNASKTMAEQKQILETAFRKWKGELEQIDDVCVIGVRI